MTLAEKLQQLVDDLAVVDDPQERLTLVLDRARRIPALPAEDRIDLHRVRGCVSVVWLIGTREESRCVYRSDADSPVVRGLLALLCDFFSHAPAEEIAASTLDPLETLGVTRNLSPTRRNGLAAARRKILDFARDPGAVRGA